MHITPDMASTQLSPSKPLGNGEVVMSVKGLDLSTGMKGLTEAQKGLSFGRLSKEQEEVELRCWKPKKRRGVNPTLNTE